MRTLCKQYCEKEPIPSEREQLFIELKHKAPALERFIRWIEEEYGNWCYIPKPILSFVRCMASSSPACSYFPVSSYFRSNIKTLSNNATEIGNRYKSLLCFQTEAPVIFKALNVIRKMPLPDVWRALFIDLEEKAMAPFKSAAHQLPTPNPRTEHMAFYPQWPALHARGRYMKDRERSADRGDCCKKQQKQHSLLPGLFTVYCEHGMT